MKTPAYYESAPPILVHDPLAEVLGAAESGQMEYRYLDAVKLTGHSCPTVAGAWLMAGAALERLYPGGTARRGEVRVEFRQSLQEGVTGVVASVLGLVTGAAGAGGFKGLAGRFGRNGLMLFEVSMQVDVRLTRLDTGRSVAFTRSQANHAPPAGVMSRLHAALEPGARDSVRSDFTQAWGQWVARILEPGGAPPWVEAGV